MKIFRKILEITALALAFSCKYPEPYRPLLELLDPGIYGLEIILDSGHIHENDTVRAHAMAILPNGKKAEVYGEEVAWESLSPGIASVDKDGKVTGLSVGTGEIRVFYRDLAACSEIIVARKPDYSRIMISEVLYDPAESDDGREFIELYNDGDHECDIGGLLIVDGNSSSAPFVFSSGSRISAKGRLILAQSAEGFGDQFGASPDYTGFKFALNNSGEAVIITRPDGTVIDALFIKGGSEEYPSPETWGSGALPSAQSGNSVQRINFPDTDTFLDWTSGLPSPWE